MLEGSAPSVSTAPGNYATLALGRAAEQVYASGRAKRVTANNSFACDKNGYHVINHGAPGSFAKGSNHGSVGAKKTLPARRNPTASTSSHSGPHQGRNNSASHSMTKKTASGQGHRAQPDQNASSSALSAEVDRLLGASDEEPQRRRGSRNQARSGRSHGYGQQADGEEEEPEEDEGDEGGRRLPGGAQDEYDEMLEDGEEREGEGEGEQDGEQDGEGGEDGSDEQDYFDTDASRGYDAENEASFEVFTQEAGNRKRSRRTDERIEFDVDDEEQLSFAKPIPKRLRLSAEECCRAAEAEDEAEDLRNEAERRHRLALPDNDDEDDDDAAIAAYGGATNPANIPSIVAQWRSHRQLDNRHRLLVSQESLDGEYAHFHAAQRHVIDNISSKNPWPTMEEEIMVVHTAWRESFDTNRDGIEQCPAANNPIIKALRARLGNHRSEVLRHVKNGITDWYLLNDPATRKLKAANLLENFNWSWRDLTTLNEKVVRKGCFGHLAILRAIQICFFSPAAGAQGIGFSLPAFADAIPKSSVALVGTAIYAALRNIAEGHQYKFSKRAYGDVYNRIRRHLDERINTGRIVYGVDFATRLREEIIKRVSDDEPLEIGQGFASDDQSDDQLGW